MVRNGGVAGPRIPPSEDPRRSLMTDQLPNEAEALEGVQTSAKRTLEQLETDLLAFERLGKTRNERERRWRLASD
jgi:hypothetical protein